MSKKIRKISECKADTKAEIFDPNLINLPIPNEFVDLMTQFIKGIRLQGKNKGRQKSNIHRAHKNTLALRQTWSGRCGACNDVFLRLAFVCDPCNLNICVGCAVFPGTVSHRYDKHPFTLTYSPPPLKDPNVDEEYYCEICEGEINPNLWFYLCVICDQSLHTLCSRPID
ncbi:hypothetical protein ACSBR2_017860 [Camellia fascicularis]